MILDDLSAVCAILRREKLHYIVVGGAALERRFPIGTADIDLVIAVGEFASLPGRLARIPGVRAIEPLGTIIGCEILVETHWTDVEFINPRLFSGKRSAQDFVRYVSRFRSDRTEVGRVARPEIVWYMRLATRDWVVYGQKILRDVRAGVPPTVLETVLEVAGHLGNREVLEPRVERVRELLELRQR